MKKLILISLILSLLPLVSAGNWTYHDLGVLSSTVTNITFIINSTSGLAYNQTHTINAQKYSEYLNLSCNYGQLMQEYIYGDGVLVDGSPFPFICKGDTKNLNLSGNLTADHYLGNISKTTGEHWLNETISGIEYITGGILSFNSLLNISTVTGNLISSMDAWFRNLFVSGNITTQQYFKGQPLDGSIGSGIINSSSNKIKCGCINVTDEGGLDAKYPSVLVKVWNLNGTNTYCYIPNDTVTTTDNQNIVYYTDSTCTLQSTTWDTYFDKNLNPPNYVRIFSVYARDGDIEVIAGNTLLGLVDIKNKWLNVNCEGGGHLKICFGIQIKEGTFPYFNQTAGSYAFVDTEHTSAKKQSNIDGIHQVGHVGGSFVHKNGTGLNVSYCDDGTNLIPCSNNFPRRTILYTMGFGVAGTHIHQLAPLDSEYYTNMRACTDIVNTPISYTLPNGENSVAVIYAIICAEPNTASWDDIEYLPLDGGITPTVRDVDLTPYLRDDENIDMPNYNITADCMTINGSIVCDWSKVNLSGGITYTGGDNISLAGNIISINKSFAGWDTDNTDDVTSEDSIFLSIIGNVLSFAEILLNSTIQTIIDSKNFLNKTQIQNETIVRAYWTNVTYDTELKYTNTSLLNSSNITCVREDTGYKCYYNGSIGAGGEADGLGNHTASRDINLSGHSIIGADTNTKIYFEGDTIVFEGS